MINRRNILKAFGIGAGAAAIPAAAGVVLASGSTVPGLSPVQKLAAGPDRVDQLRRRFLLDAQKTMDIQTFHVSYVIPDSEFNKSDDAIAARYFEPACRALEDMAISLRSKATSIRVESEHVGVDQTGLSEGGLRVTVYADMQCPWDRVPDHDAWKELESKLFINVLYKDGRMKSFPAFRQGKSIMAPYEGDEDVAVNVVGVQEVTEWGGPKVNFGPKQTVVQQNDIFIVKSEPFVPVYERKISHGDMLMVKTV